MKLENRLYRPLVWSVAVALLASGVLLSVQMLTAVVGPFRLSDIGAADPRAAVALWRPLETATGVAARSLLARELVESGRAVREVTTLGDLDPARTGALVLSEPRRLDATQLQALRGYLDAGGGAVLLGSIAVRDPDGTWRGYDAMSDLLGAPVVAIPAREAEAIQAARRGPLSSALLPRQRIDVTAEPEHPGLVVPDAELRWSGARTDAAAPAASLAIARGAGRLAWIAVDPERARDVADDRAPLRRVFEAAVAWVSRTPWVEVLAWPDGARFGAVIELDEATPRGDALAQGWRTEIDAALADGGLAELDVPGGGASLQEARRRVDEAGGWSATRVELSSWTRTRAAVKASVRRAGPQRLLVEVTNVAPTPVETLVLRVHLNEPARVDRIEATKLGQAIAIWREAGGAERIDVVLPRLEARRSAAYNLDYQPRTDG